MAIQIREIKLKHPDINNTTHNIKQCSKGCIYAVRYKKEQDPFYTNQFMAKEVSLRQQ